MKGGFEMINAPPLFFFKCTLFICNTLSDCSVKIIYYLGKKGACLPPKLATTMMFTQGSKHSCVSGLKD